MKPSVGMEKLRKGLFISLCLLYFPPLIVLGRFSFSWPYSWLLIPIWSLVGFGCLVYQWKLFETRVQEEVFRGFEKEFGSYDQQQAEQVKLLTEELHDWEESEKLLQKKITHLKEAYRHQEEEYTSLQSDLQDQLSKRESSLSESRLIIRDQRLVIEKKQEEINVLGMQINDLKYDLEGLLSQKKDESSLFIRDEPTSHIRPIHQPIYKELSLAEKLGGYMELMVQMSRSNPFSRARKEHQLPLRSLVIDQRRFFDRLQHEGAEIVLVYSYQESKLIFINQKVKDLLGWSPDKFIQDFSMLVQKGLDQWHLTLRQLNQDEVGEVRLLMKRRSGQNVLANCYLKMVPQGPFEGHALGILSSASKR